MRVAPSPGAIPKLQPSPGGRRDVNNSSRFVSVYPIPAGFTVVSHRLIGGDAFHRGYHERATATLCTTFNVGHLHGEGALGQLRQQLPALHRRADAHAVNMAGGTADDDADPGDHPPGHRSVGTVGQFKLTEMLNITAPSADRRGPTATSTGIPRIRRRSTRASPRRWGRPVNLSSTTIN